MGQVHEGWVFTNSHEWLKLSHSQPYVGADRRPRPEPIVNRAGAATGAIRAAAGLDLPARLLDPHTEIIAAAVLIFAFGVGHDSAGG